MEYETPIQPMLPKLVKAETTQHVFYQLSPLLNFIDYHLLKHLIKMLGSDELKQDMRLYEEKIDIFMKRTILADIVDHWPGKSLPTENQFQNLLIKIKAYEDMRICTLEKLNQLRQKFCCLSEILSGIIADISLNVD